MYLVPKVKIRYAIDKKIDVFIGINKLKENINERDTTLAYETNVTDISNVITDLEAFELDFINENGQESTESCSFRKYDENPLFIVCFISENGTNWLKEITEEKIYNEINVKYNFRIQPVKNTEEIYYERESGSFIFYLYPEILNFTQTESLIIEYLIESPNSLNGITFNENSQDLNCETIGKGIKRCIVPKSHFIGKTSGYYFTKHINHLSKKSTNYEVSPVKVILEDSTDDTDSKGNIYSITLYYSLLLILIMC